MPDRPIAALLSSVCESYSSQVLLAAMLRRLSGGRQGRKGQWRRAAFRCAMCFFSGFLLGMFPFGHVAEDVRSHEISCEMKPPPYTEVLMLWEGCVIRNRDRSGEFERRKGEAEQTKRGGGKLKDILGRALTEEVMRL
ncbi:hypothetical protein Fmac_008478 [Flemingia macrophylla]|uniref:Uncharacterized protein n=1 Tax=Flemingia macrophylla TaxID=520843 RepID=A0ABD1MXK7_9FABA